jgi:hypothetical protein
MRLFDPDGTDSVVGQTPVSLVSWKSRAIVRLMVAACILLGTHQLGIGAEPVDEANGTAMLLDPTCGEAPAETLELLSENAAETDRPHFKFCSLTGVDHVYADNDVVPMAFNQPAAAPRPARPSYLEPSSTPDENLPQPSYLEGETEALPLSEQMEQFNQRLKELEAAKVAGEDATRAIIRRTYAERGSSITDNVVFGGTLETLTFWQQDFDNTSQSDIILDTAELDFEIQVNPWVLGSFVVEYVDGTDFLFPTNEGDEGIAVDRLNVRQAWVTVGDTANYPLFATVGRDVVPFGISTGDPVTDVLTIVDPLTVEVFEMREDFMMIGFVGPTCCPPPAAPTPIPARPVRPILFNPLVRNAATRMCSYCPCTPNPPPAPTYLPPPTCRPPFNGAIYFFNGDTTNAGNDHIEHMGGTLGYFTRGTIPRLCIPWSLDLDVDATSSVFDSNFLAFEYRPFLDQIGYVPGMAASAKYSIGPIAMVLEWNGAINDANFTDDDGNDVSIRPTAWQVAFAYQFDWNPTVEIIGAQGTYIALAYSESQDLAGVQKTIGDPPTLIRVGNVPERRLSAGVGEWVLDGLRVAFEYSHAVDYGIDQGGTGNTADGVFMQVTYEW